MWLRIGVRCWLSAGGNRKKPTAEVDSSDEDDDDEDASEEEDSESEFEDEDEVSEKPKRSLKPKKVLI